MRVKRMPSTGAPKVAKFAVGEICDVWGTRTNQWYECSIVALPGGEPHATNREAYVIHIPHYPRVSGTGYWGAFEWQLRKRKPRPPERECDKLVPWDDCLWQPKARVTT